VKKSMHIQSVLAADLKCLWRNGRTNPLRIGMPRRGLSSALGSRKKSVLRDPFSPRRPSRRHRPAASSAASITSHNDAGTKYRPVVDACPVQRHLRQEQAKGPQSGGGDRP
jgi:hypothetical protein